MNTRLSFVTFFITIALGVTAWASALLYSYGTVDAMVQPVADPAIAPAPITDNAAPNAVRAPVESRLWSGDVFLNNNDAPDHGILNERLDIQPSTAQMCMSEDSRNRRHGGCVE